MFSENLICEPYPMQNKTLQILHVTIDDIEFDQPQFQKLLATHGELVLIDQGIAIARLLPPMNNQAINSPPSPLENHHVS